MASVIASGGFGAICGSSIATAATMSRVAYPEMKRHGYKDGLAGGAIAAGFDAWAAAAPFRRYVFSLFAERLADLLDQYQVYRGDWLQDWAQGHDRLRSALDGSPGVARAVPADPVVLGLGLLGYAVNVFIFVMGRLWQDAPPILGLDGRAIADPLPQALVLTAIVIGFAVAAYLTVLVYRLYTDRGTANVTTLFDSTTPGGAAAKARQAARNVMRIYMVESSECCLGVARNSTTPTGRMRCGGGPGSVEPSAEPMWSPHVTSS